MLCVNVVDGSPSTFPTLFESTILGTMKRHGILSSILTVLRMQRERLITKETVKAYVEGKFHDCKNMVSINDDLQNFLIKIQNQKVEEGEIGENVDCFFTPKLTNSE